MDKSVILDCLKKIQAYIETDTCPTLPEPEGEILFENDFSKGFLDSKWRFFNGCHRDAENTSMRAFVTNQGYLKMEAIPRSPARPETSYIRTWDDQNPQLYDNPSHNYMLDLEGGPVDIEFSVNLSKASGSQGAWWAFWLHTPGAPRFGFDPYDGNKNTGMEIDIIEYAPHLPLRPGDSGRTNGFNCAAFTRLDGGLHPETPAGDGFFYNINDYIETPVDLTADTFHKFNCRIYPGTDGGEKGIFMYINDQLYWTIDDPNYIPETNKMFLVMSWEIGNGVFGHPTPTFEDVNKKVSVLVDYVKVTRI